MQVGSQAHGVSGVSVKVQFEKGNVNVVVVFVEVVFVEVVNVSVVVVNVESVVSRAVFIATDSFSPVVALETFETSSIASALAVPESAIKATSVDVPRTMAAKVVKRQSGADADQQN